MYIKCIYVYTRAIHKQSITVTIIGKSLFFFSPALCFNSRPDFLVDGLCCRNLKGKATRFFTRGVVSGVLGTF